MADERDDLGQRLEQLERRVLSDLGDGRGSGNVWRNVRENTAEINKAVAALGEVGRRLKESQAGDREALEKLIGSADQKISTIEVRWDAARAQLEAIALTTSQQNRDLEALADQNEKQQRQIEALTDRLNGKGLLQQDPYEKLVAQVRQISELMAGGEGQISFVQLRNSIQNTQFLGKVLYGAIGLFGIGGLMAAGLALFGVDKVPPEVLALQEKMADIRGDIDRLQEEWSRDLQRRLDEQGPR